MTQAAFAPGGRTLATASFDRTVRLWNITDPAHPKQLSQLTGHTEAVEEAAFSADGHTLATGGDDRTVRLRNISDPGHPRPSATLTGHTDEVDSVQFSADGCSLATAGIDGTARLWTPDPETVTARIRTIAHPRMTRTEWGHFSPGVDCPPLCP